MCLQITLASQRQALPPDTNRQHASVHTALGRRLVIRHRWAPASNFNMFCLPPLTNAPGMKLTLQLD